jgi:hypothetical protein
MISCGGGGDAVKTHMHVKHCKFNIKNKESKYSNVETRTKHIRDWKVRDTKKKLGKTLHIFLLL